MINNTPPKLVFICNSSSFSIVDKSLLASFLSGDTLPWMSLSVGPGEIFESRPVKVFEYKHPQVSVVTKSYTVNLNLQTGDVSRVLPDGTTHEFRGGLNTADIRQGWIPVSQSSGLRKVSD